jgi:hypothetical protein
LCAYSWSFEVFSPGIPAVSLREGCADNVTPYRVLVVGQITSFLPSAKGREFPLLDVGAEALLQSQWGVLGLRAP